MSVTKFNQFRSLKSGTQEYISAVRFDRERLSHHRHTGMALIDQEPIETTRIFGTNDTPPHFVKQQRILPSILLQILSFLFISHHSLSPSLPSEPPSPIFPHCFLLSSLLNTSFLPKMTSPIWSDGFFPANNISIHYFQSLPSSSLAISALPVLIYLHGLVMSGGTLIEPATSFINDFKVILPDARGHGLSSPIPKGSFLMPNLVADAISVIEKFSNGLPVYLMGHSMGAATAARVAKLRPDLVRALILEEPPWSRFPGAPPNISNSLNVASTLGEPTRDLRNMSDTDFFAFDTAGQGLPDFAMSASQAQRAWDVDDCEETLLELDIDVVEAVGGIKVPLELQMGDLAADCPSFFASALRPHIASEILLTYKSANLYFFENGSHLLHIDPTVGVWTKEVLRYFKSYKYNVM